MDSSQMEYSRAYKLNPAVFYRIYEECVVVYNTQTQMMYSFNESAGDIIGRFEEYATADEVICDLLQLYDIDDEKQFRDDIYAFVKELEDKRLIHSQYQQIEVVNNLEKQISSIFANRKHLYSASIEATYKCNERCRHCYIAKKEKKELSTEQIKDILDQLSEMRVFEIVFTGGEFFTRQDAFDLLEYAYQKRFLVDIFTNGTLLSGEDVIRIKEIYPRCVHFSVYSYKPEVHDGITMLKGSFERTIKAIKYCSLIGIPVNIKTPVFSETIGDIDGLVELANSLGVSIELGKNITPKKNGDLSPTAMKIQDQKNDQIFFEKVNNAIEPIGIESSTKSDRICGAGGRSISINPYGEVFPCNMLPLCIGDITKESINDIWEKSERLQWWREHNYKTKKEGCEDCKIENQCIFCPGEAMMRSGNPLLRYEAACTDTRYAVRRQKQS